MTSPNLTAIVLTLNEAKHIEACVQSLQWADEIVVFDSYSEDETVDLAQKAGATVYQSKFENYAQQRNAALDKVQAEWVFFVDADERGSDDLGAEIRDKIQNCPQTAWHVPRHNYIFGKLTLGAGWFPDYQLRLIRRTKVRYIRPVHEIGEVEGEIGHLTTPLIHYNYEDLAQFHQKQRAYSTYDAQILKNKRVHPKLHNFILQPWRQFWWRYIKLEGYRAGIHGFHLSLLMAYYEWVKYRKLAWFWRKS